MTPISLTPAESAVLVAASRGLTARETAAERGCGLETVKTQRRQVLRKLRARNMTQAVAMVRPRSTSEPVSAQPAEAISPGQLSALHAKANAIAAATGEQKKDVKAAALERASRRFGRTIESALALTRIEASLVLDELDELEDAAA
jgi:DNA-binding CsgD family transcriptional regulator